MAMSQLILARPDASCGKVFHANRRGAEQRRVALEIWNRATGCAKENYRLVSFQCNRCGGFHIGQKRIDRLRPAQRFPQPVPRNQPGSSLYFRTPPRQETIEANHK